MSLARRIKREQIRKAKNPNMRAFYDHADRIVAEWDKRERELSTDRTMYAFSFVLAMCCRVLVHDFGWGRLPKDRDADERFRLVRFARAVSEEINRFDATRKDAVARYCDEVYQDIGVRFEYK